MNIAFSDLFGKKLALLLHFRNENGEQAAGLVCGTAFLHEGKMAIHRGNLLPPLSLPLEIVWRAKLVPGEMKDLLKKADYCLQATVAELGLHKGFQSDWH
jgi:hypothetical protein